jgi:predicted metal-dependent peptidase
MHMSRAKMYADQGTFDGQPFDPRLWNMAGDYIINDMLVKSGIGQMPKIGLLDAKFTSEMLTDDVYRELMKQQSGNKGGNQGQGQPQGGKGADGNQGDTLDAHIHDTTQTTETEMKRAIATAKEAAKAMGKMPAALERMVDQYLQPKVKWREKLRHCVTRATSREASTWASPHRRRLVTQRIYYPSYTGFGAGKIVVAFDTSGSVGQRELNQYMGELSDILDTCRPEQVIVVSCDAELYEDSITYLEDGHDLINHPPKIIGGGGTSFVPVFDWIDSEGIEPACVIYLTDLCGTFPKDEPKYPVIWATTMEGEAPFGETIFIDAKEVA